MNLGLGHAGARFVLVIRRRSPGDETWWSPRSLGGRTRDWGTILAAPLSLLALVPRATEPATLRCGLGEIAWREGRLGSTIDVRLTGGSERKRRLVVAALLRAARYARSGPSGRGGG